MKRLLYDFGVGRFLRELREQLCAEVTRMQGDRGYVLFAREGFDRCYAVIYCPDECTDTNILFEDCIDAVRVKDGRLQIIHGIDTSDKDAQWITEHSDWWEDIDSSNLCTEYTLITIAENLYMYDD